MTKQHIGFVREVLDRMHSLKRNFMKTLLSNHPKVTFNKVIWYCRTYIQLFCYILLFIIYYHPHILHPYIHEDKEVFWGAKTNNVSEKKQAETHICDKCNTADIEMGSCSFHYAWQEKGVLFSNKIWKENKMNSNVR